MTHKLESRLPVEISTTSDMHMIITSMAKSEEELNILLMKVKEESKKTEQGNALILQARLQQYMN